MQMQGLVRFFAALLIIFSLYQMSFTWFTNSHETKMRERAERQVKAVMPTAAVKYPGDKGMQTVYQDSIDHAINTRYQRLLDSTSNSKISWWGTSYKDSKNQEAKLGLDLQGGMNVTLEVGMADLLRSLANYTTDKNFNDALNRAVAQKATSGDDLIDLFVQHYDQIAPDNNLAPLFTAKSNGKLSFQATDAETLTYLRNESNTAFTNTYNILNNRIDRFGVASPNINPDPSKKIITVELAGVTDRERVRQYLQSSANLQFFELYNISEIGEAWQRGEQILASALRGNQPAVDSLGQVDSAALTQLDSLQAADTSMAAFAAQNPVTGLMLQIFQPQQDANGTVVFPSAIGLVAAKDTQALGERLRNPLFANQMPRNLKFAYGWSGGDNEKESGMFGLYALKTVDGNRAKLEGEHVSDARQDYDERGRVSISMNMDQIGARIWAKMTEENVGKGIAIVLDDFVQTAPTVNGPIPNGSSQITGSYQVKEAQDIAELLKSGKLPAPATIVAYQEVGPTLGQAAIRAGSFAFMLSFAVIFVLMIVYYNTSGFVANAALILNILFTIAILTSLGNTFTAASIAGLVLTIGMAVDTNVIIFERIKEELDRGKSYETAVKLGYNKSLAPVLDSHITTLITAIILLYFGLGPVKGFATVQIVGIILNLFCGILISRTITDWFTRKGKHLNYFTALGRRVFRHANYDFIKWRKYAYILSGVILLLGIATYFNGFDQGVEFKGGRSYTVRFPNAQSIETVANALEPHFDGEQPIVKTIGSSNQLNITTSYLIEQTSTNADSLVERALYTGLGDFLPQGTTFEEFGNSYRIGSQTVLPTISDDLKRGAVLATIFAVLGIMLYIFIRFRDWRYSLGTVVALVHDVLVTLIVFSFARKIVPFPLEIDQHFIAAILTVIGFSMNDTVIIFDRIRENSGLMRSADNATVINKSINDTLSRTFMTSLTVFLTILILFLIGGEVTRGFAFAMLVGIISGVYSTVFVGSPILVDLAKGRHLGSSDEKHHKNYVPAGAGKKRPSNV